MRTKSSILTLLTLLLFAGVSFAQDYAFQVLAAKGDITANGKKVMVGTKLNKGQVVKMATDGYLGLSAKNGQTLDLRKAGEYKVDALLGKVAKAPSSLASQYLAYVQSEVTQKDGDANGDRHAHQGKTGAVHRGSGLQEPIVVNLPKTATVFGEDAVISWQVNTEKEDFKNLNIEKYKVIVSDMFGNVLMEKETEDTKLAFNFSDFKNESGTKQVLLYHVKSATNEAHKSREQSIRTMNTRDRGKISEQLQSLGEAETAIAKVIQARFFEDHSLYSDAYRAYNEALEMAPGVEAFERLYQSFLARIPQ